MARKSTSKTSKTRTARKTQPAPRQARQAPSEGVETTPHKPVFRAWTWITVLLFAALVLLAVYLNRRAAAPTAEATPSGTVTYVFTSAEGLPTSIEVKPADGDPVRIARNEKNAWALELPEKAEANQALAEAAATQMSLMKVIGTIDLAPDILGLDKPAYVITIKFTGGKEHVLEVGDKTPTNAGYYVRVDKEKTDIVELSGVESLLNLVTSPPYLNTPTPSPLPPTPTGTSIPPTGTNTPELTVTPTP